MTRSNRKNAPATKLEPGDLMPRWRLQRGDGSAFDPHGDADAGRFYLLVLSGDPSRPKVQPVLAELAALRDRLIALSVLPFTVVPGSKAPADLPFECLHDPEGKAFQAAGFDLAGDKIKGGNVLVLVIGPNQRILASWWAGHATDTLSDVMAAIEGRVELRRSNMALPIHPPALIVPDVLSRADCRKLIGIYENDGHEYVEPGHNRLQGRTTDCKMKVPDYGRSDRTDHWICSPKSNAFIDERIARRLLPEIKKAYHYKVTGHERYRIACYEGPGQASRHGHRDNTLPMVAHRRFAVTINLNAEDYEGAELRFAEFGEATYKTPSGAAIVFSCSLLHEVMAMRKGRRFALLAFLFGEA